MEDIEIEVWVSTCYVGSENKITFSVNREEWESMSDENKDEFAREYMFDMIEWGWDEK